MAQVLYRKWRPATWDQVVGQSHVIQTLRNAVRREHLSHAYLFAGPRGTGKTTTARLLAKAANCLAPEPGDRPDNSCEHCQALNASRFLDLIEIDAASNTSVDDVRDLRERINFAPNVGRFKVYIVDEVHMLSTAAFNALLKTLEEPPPHAIFILATTEVQKIPATVLSRCQRHEFRRLPVEAMTEYLTQMVEQEEFEVDPEALDLIARQATGSLRDAVSLLDQLVSIGERVTLEQTRQVLGLAGHAVVGQLVDALADGQIGLGLKLINQALDGGVDAKQLARQTVTYLRGVLLSRMGQSELPELAAQERAEMADLAQRMETALLLRAMRAFSQASHARSGNWQPALQLELALLEAAQVAQPESPVVPPAQSAEHGPADRRTDERGGTDAAPGRVEETQATGPTPADGPSTESGTSEQAASADASTQPVESSEQVQPQTSDPASERAQRQSSGAAAERAAVGFEAVLDAWPDLLASAYRRNPRAQALLNSCKPLELERGALVLGFQSDLLREKMEKGPNLETVTESLHEVIGSPLQVRCVLLQDWDRDLENVSTPPPMQEGGMVATALRDLGAQIVDFREEDE